MTFRPLLVLLALLPAGTAMAAGDVVPRAGVALSGAIKFPREQRMTLETGSPDAGRLKVRMGFDGKCNGGGLQEAWASTILAKQSVRVTRRPVLGRPDRHLPQPRRRHAAGPASSSGTSAAASSPRTPPPPPSPAAR